MERLQNKARILTLALGATTAMWLFTYIALLFSGKTGGEILFVIVALCIPFCSSIPTRHGAPLKEGAWIGFWSSMINLMLIGSIVGGKAPSDMLVTGALWVFGLIMISVLLGLLGARIGKLMPSCDAHIHWQFAFFVVASALVFLMLVTGGLVTGMEAGLAVPDWPNSYGHNMLLYPFTEMVSPENKGVFFEHAHRLTGMFVGLTSLLMIVSAWKWSTNTTVRVFAVLVFVLVCVQGLLGGLRVTGFLTLSQDRNVLTPNIFIAIVHGVVGQLIFGGFVWIAAMMSPSWSNSERVCIKRDKTWTWLLVLAMVLQLILGALYRHMMNDSELAAKATHVLYSHIGIAFVVLVFAVIVGLRLLSRGSHILKLCSLAILILVSLQLLLGGGALVAVLIREGTEIPPYELLLTTVHQANGALLLGASFLALAWTRRLNSV